MMFIHKGFLSCKNRGGYSDNRYNQPYSYNNNNNQYYQQYPDYYSNWGYDQNTGSYGGYNYNHYDYSNQVCSPTPSTLSLFTYT